MKLGIKVKDKITGFTGIVMGHVQYLTGCGQSLVQPPVKESGDYVDSRWFDDDRLEITDNKPLDLTITTNGPDKEAPRR